MHMIRLKLSKKDGASPFKQFLLLRKYYNLSFREAFKLVRTIYKDGTVAIQPAIHYDSIISNKLESEIKPLRELFVVEFTIVSSLFNCIMPTLYDIIIRDIKRGYEIGISEF